MKNYIGIVSSGDLDVKYDIIGVVFSAVDNRDVGSQEVQGCMGCGSTTQSVRITVSREDTYQRAANKLLEAATFKGGDAVIFANFDYRISVETLGIGKASTSSQVFEVYAYGTAIRLPFEEDSV